MPSVTVRGHIDRPLNEVFAFVADSRNDVQWAPLVEGVKQIEGSGPCEGAVYEIQQRVAGGKVLAMQLATTTFVTDSELAWTMEKRGMRYRSHMIFSETASGGTRIKQRNTVATGKPARDAVWWALAPWVLRQQMRRLRAHLEKR